MIKLYQTKKLNGHLSTQFYQELQEVSGSEADSIFSWFGDFFYINRKMNLLFTNELTKFSVLFVKYRKQEHPDFASSFRRYLAFTMRLHEMDPTKYLDNTGTFARNTKANRSPIAHLSRLKIDFAPELKIDENLKETETLWLDYSRSINTYLTSYPGRNSYYSPAEVMKEELKKRGL